MNDAALESPDWLYPDIPSWAEKAFGLPDHMGAKAWFKTHVFQMLGGWQKAGINLMQEH